MNKKSILVIGMLFILLTACYADNPATSDQLQQREEELQPKEGNQALELLNRIMEQAKKGMTLGSPYNVLDSKIDEAKAEWGKPDNEDHAGKGFYATYQNKSFVFGFNEAGDIFDVRSYAKELNEITSVQIEDLFGQPDQLRETNNEEIYVYELERKIELKFIIPKEEKGVHHLSVFNPERAKNEYVLDIKGESHQLSASAWESMKEWRKQIVSFAQENENVYINGPNKKQVALTFDDGPDGKVTPAIIDILDEYNVKGNFFFLGRNVEAFPEVVKKAYTNGHLILSHSYNHVELPKLSTKEIQIEIEQAGNAIKSVIGKEPSIIRTPYGETNKQVVELAQQQGYSVVLWSIDTLDWSQKEASNIVNNVMNHVRNGDIILMHSDAKKTEAAKALPDLIEGLQEKGFEMVDLETLLNIKAYQ
ncbi:polysaccharide deacetylase family protein [Cytobacillus massiliigabonensis]|uniref:polysaccharide deacetylase family protein n=1 Tax=Cytobacillus massiliigabonensis TaxID=1871011 RepID=UPI0015E10FEF|nr:polysaccharide deacetylase family protein [Cytobacillus massiliigabonensis]